MGINPNSLVRIYIIIFVLVVGYLSYKVYDQVVFVQKQRQMLTNSFYDAKLDNGRYEDNMQKKMKKRIMNARQIMKMKALIKQINLNQKIFNEHLQESVEPKYIIVIQVHANVYYFKQLLASLKSAYAISEALLIFSHDVYDHEVNKAVHSVNFAKYMQIFYPYSIQLHPNVFPGYEREPQKGKSTERPVTRDPVVAQMKHHWWWQVNQVFKHLNVTKKLRRPILFLEEDNYVTIDFLIVFNILNNVRMIECPTCEMISLGAHKPYYDLYKEFALITLEMWEAKTPNIGIAIDRFTWRAMRNYSKDFCTFNDPDWGNSLKHIGSLRMDTNFYFIAIDGPRVLRINKCFEADLTCKPERKVQEVVDFVDQIHMMMFPYNVTVRLKIGKYFTVEPQGSFDDYRDHDLCMYFARHNVWY